MTDGLLSRDLLSDRVYAIIRASIVSGEREPGDRLVESEIARRFGISQAPVREAFKRLAHDGLVMTKPRRGSYVTSISSEELEIARQLRAVIEQMGARIAAVSVSTAEVGHLRSITRRMRDAAAKVDSGEFRTLDMEFHAYV